MFAVGSVAAFLGAIAIGPIATRLEIEELPRRVLLGLPLPLLALGLVCIGAALWVRPAWRRRDLPTALLRIGVANVLLYATIMAWLLPAFTPIKSYVPECRWIREQIGSETRIGMVNLQFGNRKRGAFAYYTGLPVELLATPDDLKRFFEEHPHSLVIVNERAGNFFFVDDKTWRERSVRIIKAGKYSYFVLRDS